MSEEQPAQEAQKEDPVQKEMEAKKKEVLDLTVCSTLYCLQCAAIYRYIQTTQAVY